MITVVEGLDSQNVDIVKMATKSIPPVIKDTFEVTLECRERETIIHLSIFLRPGHSQTQRHVISVDTYDSVFEFLKLFYGCYCSSLNMALNGDAFVESGP